jgi:hypothetical protein
MKKLAFGALLVGLFVACSDPAKKDVIVIPDGTVDTGGPICNVLTQTGCNAGEKCTWIEDTAPPNSIGHIGCAPDTGGVATGAACTYAAPAAGGFDNCAKTNVCVGGVCKLICDNMGGSPGCPTNFACGIYEGLFGDPQAAGVCDKTCDPLNDNDFDGSGSALSKSGTACAANSGCYGLPNDSPPTHFTCVREVNTTLQHRAPCTGGASGNGCANAAGNPYLNGCAQGYTPFFRDAEGSTQWDCFAYCSPGNAYMGNAAAQHPNGISPHGCNSTDARSGGGGSFGVVPSATGTTNGEHCMFGWVFEYDMNGMHVSSPTSDTLGICIDHTKYKYDSNNSGAIDGSDAFWPACNATAVGSQVNGGYDATFFGCVTTAVAGAAGTLFDGKARFSKVAEFPRPAYHAVFRQE